MRYTLISASKDDRAPIYLNCSALRPGDVLLTLGSESVSKAIARLSGGPFSHAALVVSPQMLFESEDLGVGYTARAIHRVELHAEKRVLLSRLEHVDAALVLRHPALGAHAARKVGSALRKVLRPLVGLEYPQWHKLAPAAPGGPVPRAFVGLVLRIKDVMDGAKIRNPGPFCSQLVCAALAEALPSGLACFDPPREPMTVGPNALLESELRPVAGLVRHADDAARLDMSYLAGLQSFPLLDRSQQTLSAARNRSAITDMQRSVDAIRKLQQARRRV